MKKIGLAALAAICLWTGAAVPVAAQGWPTPVWKIERYDNGYLYYYCNGTFLWTNNAEDPGTLIEVMAEDPSVCG